MLTRENRKAVRAALARSGPAAIVCGVTATLAWSFVHVFAGEPCCGDLTFHLAEVARLADAIRAGDWHWWNPGGNSGFASGYYYQVIPQVVPAAVSALTGLAPLTSFQLAIYIPLLLVPLAAYRAVRIAGGSAWQAAGAAVAVPFAVGSSRWGHGADGTFLIGVYTQLWAFAAFPLAFAYAVRWLDEGRRLPATLAWSLFVGLCHPFAGAALGVGLGGVLLARRCAWRALVRLLALGACLLIGSAVAWLPAVIDYEGFGGFPHRPADEVGPGFVELARWFVRGEILDHGRALRLMTAALPVVAYFARAPWLRDLWAAAAAFALLLGLGPHLPLIGDNLLPPIRFIGTLQIVLALLAGAGMTSIVERVVRSPRAGRPFFPRAGIAAVAAAAIVVAIGGAGIHRSRVRVAADIRPIARHHLATVIDAMAAAPPGRVQVPGSAFSHWAAMLPYVEQRRAAAIVTGGAALQSSPNYAYLWQLETREPERMAWVFDAPLVLSRPGEVTSGSVLAATAAYELRLLASPGLVSPVQIVGKLPPDRYAARAAAIGWLWSDLPMRNQVLARDAGVSAGPVPCGRVNGVTRDGSAIRADVEAGSATTFVVRESWHPRWHASIDGAAVPVRRVTPDHLALDVPRGRHVLDRRCQRPLWTWLLWLAAPLVVGAGAMWDRRRSPARALPRMAAWSAA